jgi:glycosyltransferase involved in cell wall biosynthesis
LADLKNPILTRASVCILTFNSGSYIAPQLQSIIHQLNEDDEIIVVDNNSSDKTRSIIEALKYKDSRIKTCYLNANLGITKGFEISLSLALGKFIFLCDQDDVWLPTRLEKQIATLAYSDLSICNASFTDENLNLLGCNTFSLRFPKLGWSNLYKNAFIGCTMAMTREALDYMLPFPDGISMHDWYIAQVAYQVNLRVATLPEVLHLYRRHGGAASKTGFTSARPIFIKIMDRIKLLKYTIKALK